MYILVLYMYMCTRYSTSTIGSRTSTVAYTFIVFYLPPPAAPPLCQAANNYKTVPQSNKTVPPQRTPQRPTAQGRSRIGASRRAEERRACRHVQEQCASCLCPCYSAATSPRLAFSATAPAAMARLRLGDPWCAPPWQLPRADCRVCAPTCAAFQSGFLSILYSIGAPKPRATELACSAGCERQQQWSARALQQRPSCGRACARHQADALLVPCRRLQAAADLEGGGQQRTLQTHH